jgi:hypothetical protein
MTRMRKNWVSETERERFTEQQVRESDALFRAIGIDPDVYLNFARAQVVRPYAAFDVNNSGDDAEGAAATRADRSHMR